MFYFKKIVKIFLITFFIIFISIGCKKKKLVYNGNYEEFLKNSASLTCDKIKTCYSHVFRTFPRGMDKMNTTECINQATHNLAEKILWHTEEIKKLSIECYPAIVDADCKDISFILFKNQNCYMLYSTVKKVLNY